MALSLVPSMARGPILCPASLSRIRATRQRGGGVIARRPQGDVAIQRRRIMASAVVACRSFVPACGRTRPFPKRGSAEHPGPWRRFERESPNELWQMDFKGHFAMHGGRCHPLTALDDHSRYNLVLAACGDEQGRTVRHHLEEAFRRYALPLAMLMDNGRPWGRSGRRSADSLRRLADAARRPGAARPAASSPDPGQGGALSIAPSRPRWSAGAASAISPTASAPSTTGARTATTSGPHEALGMTKPAQHKPGPRNGGGCAKSVASRPSASAPTLAPTTRTILSHWESCRQLQNTNRRRGGRSCWRRRRR